MVSFMSESEMQITQDTSHSKMLGCMNNFGLGNFNNTNKNNN